MTYPRCADEFMAYQEPDELPIQTDSPCPFCGRLVEWNGNDLYCQPCGQVWSDFHELRVDENMQRWLNRRTAVEAVAQ